MTPEPVSASDTRNLAEKYIDQHGVFHEADTQVKPKRERTNLCPKHPYYKGVRPPVNGCPSCVSAFMARRYPNLEPSMPAGADILTQEAEHIEVSLGRKVARAWLDGAVARARIVWDWVRGAQ